MLRTRVRFLTVSELSEYLHVHRTTIYRALKERKLPGFRIGSDWRFSVEAIEQWQREQNVKDETTSQIDDELAPSVSGRIKRRVTPGL
jgi:excisionase family DNA binding protein